MTKEVKKRRFGSRSSGGRRPKLLRTLPPKRATTEPKGKESNEKTGVRAIYLRARRIVILVERDPFVRLFAAIVVIGTFLQLWIDLSDRAEERLSRHEERIARTWETLLSRDSTDSQKKKSIEYLFRLGESFERIDLSCETLNRGWDEENAKCANPLDLSGIALVRENFQLSEIQFKAPPNEHFFLPKRAPLFSGVCIGRVSDVEARRDLSDTVDVWRAELRNGAPNFRYAKLSGIDFSSAVLPGTDFHGADLRGSRFVEADLRAADFTDASLARSRIEKSVLDGSTFGGDADSRYAHKVDARAIIDRSLLDFAVFKMSNPDNIFTVQSSEVENAVISIEAAGLVEDYASSCAGSPEARLQEYLEPICSENGCMSRPGWGDAVELRSAACGHPYSRTIDFWYSDLSCSVFSNNQHLELTGSNLSNARFPESYESVVRQMPLCSVEGSDLKHYCAPKPTPGGDWSVGGIPQQPWADITWDVWAFEDALPHGNFFGRAIELRQREDVD